VNNSTSRPASKKLVIGASGFLGSHVTRQLVEHGEDVRVMIRRTSNTEGIDDLAVERSYGDVFDDAALATAMTGCDVVYNCEDDAHNWTEGGAYIASRMEAENLVMRYSRENGLPAVALCISTTYGPGDWQPTPHGSLIARVAAGRFPFYLGFSSEVVGIQDAARAMLLAADRGRIGQRYIVSDRYMNTREIHAIAATAVGRRAPRIGIPMALLYVAAHFNDLAARLLRRDLPFAVVGLRMAELMSPLDHGKARRELGWEPQPVENSIREAAKFFATKRRPK